MQTDTTPPENLFNTIPPVVVALFLFLMGIEVTLSLAQQGMVGGPGGVGWRIAAIEDYGFSPAVWEQIVRGNWSFDIIKRLLTYAFVHGSFTHALFAAVLFLALGKFVGEVFRWWAVLAVVFGAAVTAALVYAAVPVVTAPLVGGYPPVYGLIGAFTFILWTNLGRTGGNQMRAFSLIGMLLAVQLVFGLLFGGGTEWIADLAGFGAGFALSILVCPGGWARMMAKLRAR